MLYYLILSMYLCLCVSMCLCISVSMYLRIYVSMYVSTYLSMHASIYPSFHLSIYIYTHHIYNTVHICTVYIYTYYTLDQRFKHHQLRGCPKGMSFHRDLRTESSAPRGCPWAFPESCGQLNIFESWMVQNGKPQKNRLYLVKGLPP
jgi:hypothetical protein